MVANFKKTASLYSLLSLSFFIGLVLLSPQKVSATVLLQGGTNTQLCALSGACTGTPTATTSPSAVGTPAFVEIYVGERNLGLVDVSIRRTDSNYDCVTAPEVAYASTSFSGTGYIMVPVRNVQETITWGSNYALCFLQDGFPADKVWAGSTNSPTDIWYRVTDSGGDPDQPDLGNTRIIATYPTSGTTTATTTTIGARVFINMNDFDGSYGRLKIHFSQNAYLPCSQSGAIIDAVTVYEPIFGGQTNGCATYTVPPFDVTFDGILHRFVHNGFYDIATTTTFPSYGKWTATYSLENVTEHYLWWDTTNIVLSSTTQFTISTTSVADRASDQINAAFDARRRAMASSTGAALASTTLGLADACSPIATSTNLFGLTYNDSFDPIGCMALIFIPSKGDFEDDLKSLKAIPPWGYAFRVYDIMSATTSTTTLPIISYTFATSSPFFAIGAITFDLNQYLGQSASLIGEMKSDRAQSLTVWQILMPIVRIVVYLILFMKIIGDILGLDFSDEGGGWSNWRDRRRGIGHVTDEQYRYKEKLYQMSQRK